MHVDKISEACLCDTSLVWTAYVLRSFRVNTNHLSPSVEDVASSRHSNAKAVSKIFNTEILSQSHKSEQRTITW